MGDSKPGMISDLVKGALTTAISVIVTFYVTSAIKKDQFQKDDFDKEKQRMESLEKTSKLLSDYVTRYDSLHSRYIDLINQKATIGNKNITDEPGERADNRSTLNNVSQILLTGNWITPDGSYNWHFSNNKLTIKGIGTYENSYEASGSYQIAGGVAKGTYHVSKFFYLPVSANYQFEATVNSDGNILYGTMIDADGNANTLALYKN